MLLHSDGDIIERDSILCVLRCLILINEETRVSLVGNDLCV